MLELIFFAGTHTHCYTVLSEWRQGSGFTGLNVGAVGIGGHRTSTTQALHASLHDAYLNAQKLNRSSSSKNLRKDIASDKKGSLEGLKRLQ